MIPEPFWDEPHAYWYGMYYAVWAGMGGRDLTLLVTDWVHTELYS